MPERKNIKKRDAILSTTGLGFIIVSQLLDQFNEWFSLLIIPGVLAIIYLSYRHYIEN